MNRFWGNFIFPIIKCINAKRILEIGCDKGDNTLNLINFCKENNAVLYAIDPVPSKQIIDIIQKNEDIINFYEDLSLNSISHISRLDAVLIDGDHNWYTVYNELLLIEKQFEKFPIVILHDISWPYSRRDMYYNPDNIPAAFLKPYSKKGIIYGQSALSDTGGINASFNNSIYENTLQNGVLTAIEDFMRDSKLKLRLIKIEGFNGLGILVSEEMITENSMLEELLDSFSVSNALSKHLNKLDETIANKHKNLLSKNFEIAKISRNTEELVNKLEKLQEELICEKEKVHYLEKESDNFQKTIQELEEEFNFVQKKRSDLLDLNTRLRSHLDTISQIEKSLRNENKQLQEIINRMYKGIYLILHSNRWAVGNFFGNLSNLLTFRKPSNLSLNFLTKVISEIPGQDLDIPTEKKNKFSKKDIIKYSIKAILRRPIKNVILNYNAYLKIKENNNKLFDEQYYFQNNMDVRTFKYDVLIHYLYFGGFEGRNPSESFDSFQYLESNGDVKQAKINPLTHFVLYGEKEGRTISSIKNVSSKQTVIQAFGEAYVELTVEDKVSVIMPTWNRKKIIKKAIDSVLNQTYQNFEIIIVDDGSTDDTESYINEHYFGEIKNDRIKYIRQINSGVSAARNTALSKSSGEYIAYLDSDNKWKPEYLEKLLKAIKSRNANTGYCGIEVFDQYRKKRFTRRNQYNRVALLQGNYIDLNCFMHKRILFKQFGGFDTRLKRLVDWDFILRITELNPPVFLDDVLVNYYLHKDLNNISNTEALDSNKAIVLRNHNQELIQKKVKKLKIAYVLWDFPSFSQTFVMNELRSLINKGYDVKVYYKVAPDKKAILDFKVDSYQVNDSEELVKLLLNDKRNLIHSHFVYPACTLLAYPAAKELDIPFTLMAHAVDIYHHTNDKRNRIEEISKSQLCKKVFVLGEFPKNYLVERGVPINKIMKIRQAVRYDLVDDHTINTVEKTVRKNVITITRFVEKKGISDLITAAGTLEGKGFNFKIYGYGPLEKELKDQIQALNLKNVILPGPLNTFDEVRDAYNKADIFVLPCIQAENGDMDGLPTVLLEAMAFGVPVISTNVSVIPEVVKDNISGFIVDQHSPEQIANKIEEVSKLPRELLNTILINARDTVDKVANINNTVNSLLDVWENRIVDIFLVTYNTDRYNDFETTKEIIRRIIELTSTPFHLTIVDNGSNNEFILYLRNLCTIYSNIRLIELKENLYCGPASNIALTYSSGEFSIYICSKEGFVSKLGWEKEMIEFMRKEENVAIAGQLVSSPSFYNGETYISQDWFSKARNQDYARENLKKEFAHVQGGIYILRNSAYQENGGFNPKLPHDYMDVEYSYYLESCGWLLGNIPTIQSVTTKTRPVISDTLDENVVAAHPLTLSDVELLNFLNMQNGKFCNICGWKGTSFEKFDHTCPSCKSSAMTRIFYRYLSRSNLNYRGLSILVAGENDLPEKIKKMFGQVNFSVDSNSGLDLVNVDVVMMYDSKIINYERLHDIVPKAILVEESVCNSSLESMLLASGYSVEIHSYPSSMQEIAMKRLKVFKKTTNS